MGKEKRMAKELKGLMPPMITVFKEGEAFDEERTRRHVEFLIKNGVQGLIPCGSTGEFAAMTMDERKKVAEVVVDEVNGRIPVYIGTAHYSTKIAMDLSKHAEKIEADGVMVIAPYYLIPTEREICEHYRSIAKSISIPLMIYNNVWFAGVELSVKTIAKLSKEGIVSSVKLAHGDPSRVHDLKYYCGNDLVVFYGHDVCALEGLAAKADGWIAGIGNLIPEHCRKLCDLLLVDKDLDKANDHWLTMLPLLHMCVNKKNGERPDWLQIIKKGLEMRGQPVGEGRRPILPITKEDERKLRAELTKMGLI